MEGHDGLRVLGHEQRQGVRGLVIGEVAGVAADARPQPRGVRAVGEHLDVVVALEPEDADAAQLAEGLRREVAGVRAPADGILYLAVRVEHGEAQAKRVGHIVRGGKRRDDHAGEAERLAVRDEREREAGQGLCAAGGAGRREELAVEVVAEHREAARVVGVLVRDEGVRDAVEVAAAGVRAAHELAARDAAVDKDAALRALDHGGVSL